MAKRHIEYGWHVEQALRTVVRDVLKRVAKEGLPGSHHFYITFRTEEPGVEIADYLRERYPTEMTIVLQYQFWDLEVDDEGFGVSLSFNNMPERIRVPFTALKVFADPGAEFGLQFTIEPENRVVDLSGVAQAPHENRRETEQAGTAAADEKRPQEGGAEIVTLDRFRRK
jgi:hypothetical protein